MKFTAPQAHILAVDDQEINLMVLERLLAPSQVTLTTATGGQEMLDLLCKEKFDLVLLDHVMPPPDGLEAFHLSKNLQGNLNPDIPFVALTGNDIRAEGCDPSLSPREATRAFYKGEGFADYLPKPILPEDAEKLLQVLLPPEKIICQEAPADSGSRKTGLFARIQQMGLAGEDPAAGQGSQAGQNSAAAGGGSSAGSSYAASAPGDSAPSGPLDIARGLTFSGGDEEMYRPLLKNWSDAYMENGYTIQKSAKDGDLNAHRIATHSLKSSSRMVGAVRLGDLAEKAEHAARDGDLEYIQANVSALLEEYGKAVEAASQYLAG
ncbi:MAG: response regulator [Treponema sp.]|nr:response regulator [Treponema sp.]